MTGDKKLRSLAADFCLSAVGGNITRVNGAIEILTELLKAARDAGGNLDAVDEIKIDWRAQDRATKTGDERGPHPASPALPEPAIEILRAVVDRWRCEYHCCPGVQYAKHGTGVPAQHSADCPFERAEKFLGGPR